MEKQILAVLPNDFSTVMRERVTVLLKMEKHHLDRKWVRTFGLSEISACCERMEEHLSGVRLYSPELQKEMLQNTAFAAYYAAFLTALPEEPPQEETTAPATVHPYRSGNRYGYNRPEPPRPHSRRDILTERLVAFLGICRAAGIDITDSPLKELMETLERDALTDQQRLDYLRLIAPMKLPEADREIAAASISNCVELPSELSEAQKGLLLKQATGDRELFASASFAEVSELLISYPLLNSIVEFLSEMDIRDQLGMKEYTQFSQNAPEYHRLIPSILGCLEPGSANAFMRYWHESGCPLGELQTMEQRLAADMELDLTEIFSSYAGYVNLLYGKRFKSIDFGCITGWQENILLHAIVKNKKHFIRMVDGNPEAFLTVPSTSILFNETLYQQHFNLNELTEKDLSDCAWMVSRRLHVENFMPERIYTFQEIRTLYDADAVYVSLYNRLTSPKQDYRLLVIRQFLKRKLLKKAPDSAELDALAEKLNTKPVDRWMQEDFKAIRDLNALDAVRLLIHFDTVRHLLPTLESREDVILVLRNLEHLAQFDTVFALKAHIVEIDVDWNQLSEIMELTDNFKAKYMEGITRFVCHNGAYIANLYQRNLESPQQEAFLRVVKAELMGQLDTLKYFEGDLQKELDLNISEQAVAYWKENTRISQDEIMIKEHDDFFSTMLLGIQPQRTCLAYDQGIYKKCLLSGFDSNKKVLYAEIAGERVGRAYLRLTKGRMGQADEGKKKTAFTFVDVENIQERQTEKTPYGEQLTLFLECPYFGGVNDQTEHQINDLMIELASRKANALGAVLVLSDDYHGTRSEGFTYTKFNIYISKTKAGAQYLDSLGGAATVDTEGCYKANTFLVRSADISE